MLDSPHTRWIGDQLHGRQPITTPIWVNLARLFPEPRMFPRT